MSSIKAALFTGCLIAWGTADIWGLWRCLYKPAHSRTDYLVVLASWLFIRLDYRQPLIDRLVDLLVDLLQGWVSDSSLGWRSSKVLQSAFRTDFYIFDCGWDLSNHIQHQWWIRRCHLWFETTSSWKVLWPGESSVAWIFRSLFCTSITWIHLELMAIVISCHFPRFLLLTMLLFYWIWSQVVVHFPSYRGVLNTLI